MRKENFPQKKRMRSSFRFARDYAVIVFDRYVRMNGYLDERKAFNYLDKIKSRWSWGDHRAHIHINNNNKLYYIEIEGDYCPIGHAGYTCDYYYHIDTCMACGSEKEIIKGKIIKFDVKRANNYKLNNFYIQDELMRCSNQHCREVKQFMAGNHALVKPARKQKVLQQRPLSKYSTTTALGYADGSIALLSFEARYINKIMSHY